MLEYKLSDDGTILEVHESILSFFDTKHSYWYYDIINWKCSSSGIKDSHLDREMDQGSIDWVKKYYLPKV